LIKAQRICGCLLLRQSQPSSWNSINQSTKVWKIWGKYTLIEYLPDREPLPGINRLDHLENLRMKQKRSADENESPKAPRTLRNPPNRISERKPTEEELNYHVPEKRILRTYFLEFSLSQSQFCIFPRSLLSPWLWTFFLFECIAMKRMIILAYWSPCSLIPSSLFHYLFFISMRRLSILLGEASVCGCLTSISIGLLDREMKDEIWGFFPSGGKASVSTLPKRTRALISGGSIR